jgi:hypothetical protein
MFDVHVQPSSQANNPSRHLNAPRSQNTSQEGRRPRVARVEDEPWYSCRQSTPALRRHGECGSMFQQHSGHPSQLRPAYPRLWPKNNTFQTWPKSSPNVRSAPECFDRNCIGLERGGRRDADHSDRDGYRDGRAPRTRKFVGLGEDLGMAQALDFPNLISRGR